MKRVLVSLFALTIAFTFMFSANASATSNIHSVNEITVEFSPNSSFTNEEQMIIVDLVTSNIDYSSVSTYNLLCTMFGHKTTTETITVIEHCVSDTEPRCLKTFQDVTACSRCDYVYIQEIGSTYIFCCD